MKITLVSPRGFLAAAAVVGALYGALHLAGIREDTTILSGTDPPGGAASAALGLVYVCLHFAWVIGAPVLVLAAGLFAAIERWIIRGTLK